MVSHRQPLIETRAIILGADYFACRLLLVSGENLFLAVVLADNIENIGEAIVIVVRSFDIRTE